MASVAPLRALNLDESQQLSFVRFFRTLDEKPSTTVRFFNRVDYYTLHGEDATFAAREVFRSLAAVKVMGCKSNELDYVTLSKNNFDNFVRDLLLVKHYRVEVYVNQGTAKNNDWVVEYKGSPGNISQFEHILFNDNTDFVVTGSIMAVKIASESGNKITGVTCMDINEFEFKIAEITDNDSFTELEALVVQLGPKECLLPSVDSPELNTIKKIMERNRVLVTTRQKNEFSVDGLGQDLDRLIFFKESQQRNAMALPEASRIQAMGALSAVIKYLNLMSDETNFNHFKISFLDLKRFLHLDAAAVTALNLLPKANAPTGATARCQSILGLLDCCRTAQGRRLLVQWIKQPLRDINLISERHDIVETFVNDSILRDSLYDDHLRRIPDLQVLSKRLSRKKASLQDCFKIYQAVDRLPLLLNAIRNNNTNNKSLKSVLTDPLNDLLIDMEKYQQMIEQTLDMDLADGGEFFVKPSFDDELTELHKKKQQLEDDIQIQLNKASRELNFEAGKQIKLESNSQLGYYFRITLKEEPILRKNNKFKILDAIKGGVRFTNDRLSSLNDDHIDIKNKYEEVQKNIVTEIISIASGYTEPLLEISVVLAKLDVLVSFAHAGATAPIRYVRPNMLEEGSGVLRLTKARHPCLELQEDMSYIANDVSFTKDECTFQIITGPNMGGKSTYIRSVGVITLMAHIGSFVPCEEADISLCDSILARIGAEDCETKGLSTFMVEMVEMAGILKMATKNSLVIIDELGRGTSTHEGCSIAWSIAEYLAKDVKAFSMFATHFHEITRLADSITTVKNNHVTALTDCDTFTLLYQLNPGSCDQSFGVHLAKMANFPDEVVQYAIDKQMDLDYGFNCPTDMKPQQKRKFIEEGLEIISKVLKKCKKSDIEMHDDDLMALKNELTTEAESTNNSFLMALH